MSFRGKHLPSLHQRLPSLASISPSSSFLPPFFFSLPRFQPCTNITAEVYMRSYLTPCINDCGTYGQCKLLRTNNYLYAACECKAGGSRGATFSLCLFADWTEKCKKTKNGLRWNLNESHFHFVIKKKKCNQTRLSACCLLARHQTQRGIGWERREDRARVASAR